MALTSQKGGADEDDGWEVSSGSMTDRIKRHGDLLILKVSSLPASIVQTDNNVLAVGETTGHSHRLTGRAFVYDNPNKETVGKTANDLGFSSLRDVVPSKFFLAKSDQELVHEEHKPLGIETGAYAVINEREYDPFAAAIVREKQAREEERKRAAMMAERTVSD